ncbi:MAG: cytochrome c biogenesis protein CcsA [Nannocystaceae bacterium]
MIAPFLLAVSAYGVAFAAFVAPSDRARQQIGAARAVLALGAVFHLACVGVQCADGQHPFSSIYLSMSLGAWLAVIGYLALSGARRPMRPIGAVFAPVAIAALTLGFVLGPQPHPTTSVSHGLLWLHISLAIVGVAGFSLATAVAALYLSFERRLRRREFYPKRPGMSLVGLDRLHWWLVAGVTPVFTIAVATGAVAAVQTGGSEMLSARVLELSASAVACLASVAVLASRAVWGLRGRRAAWLTMVCFASLVVIAISYGVRT